MRDREPSRTGRATFLLLLASACASSPAPDLATATIVDLSHSYDEDTVFWPTSPGHFELEVLSAGVTDGGWYYEANAFSTPEHGGTHLDAPVHFHETGWSADEVPLDRLVGPAIVIDVRAACEEDPDYRLTIDDVHRFESEHGAIPTGAIVLLWTGWSARWPDAASYLGDDTPGDASNLHFPSFGPEAADLLIHALGAAALGVDTASIDSGDSRDFRVHRIAGAANVVGLENLTNLDRVPPTGAWVAALPMKIAGGSGGPVRVAAFVAR